MTIDQINTDNTVFVLLSFEGPDIYSQAGGLGVRVTNLAQSLAGEGFFTHLFFIGDPHLRGEETTAGGRLFLHRWGQWISAYHPNGVYQGEFEKMSDYQDSIPPYLLQHIVQPAVRQNKLVVILAEEWQTAETVSRIDSLLKNNSLREKVIIFWNANNIFGFERINFKNLEKACTITTVSRYMKHIMWQLGLNPVVIPNGIPSHLLNRIDIDLSRKLRIGLNCDLVLAKIARWDPDKRWNMALEAVAHLKDRGMKVALIARGGMEGYGEEVLNNARSLGLRVRDVTARGNTPEDYVTAICADAGKADLLNLKFHCSQDLLRLIYHVSDAVLANSGREPFGLVGLETMAAGGIAFTGSTGEDYAISFQNSIVLETADPKEIETYVTYLQSHPEVGEHIRKSSRSTAARFTWEHIAEYLIQRLEFQAEIQGLLSLPGKVEKAFPNTVEYLGNLPDQFTLFNPKN
jgi:glycosyltransferase involved in cell wall biosynthesis